MIEFKYALPLLLMSFFSITSIVIDALFNKKSVSYFYSLFGLIVAGASSVYCLTLPAFSTNFQSMKDVEYPITNNMIALGGFPYFFDILFILAGILTVLAAKDYLNREKYNLNEFYSLLLIAISGMLMIVHSKNFLILFIGIEIMSVTFYILTGFFRRNLLSIEAAVKYFLLGAFATGFLLYGIALIYGATGTIDMAAAGIKVSYGSVNNTYLIIGLGMMIIGFAFKTAAFPFHQWAADVYQGAPTIVTGFMSTAGKIASVMGLLIVLKYMLPPLVNTHLLTESDGLQLILSKNIETVRIILAVIAAATMLFGNIVALVQKNVKRMLSYSSIAHAGYLMIGVVSNNVEGWTAISFYAVSYTLMQLGAFIVLSLLERNNEDNLNLDDYAGLYKSQPYLSAVLAMFMLSLAGIPPFAGFFGKYYLFISAIKGQFTWLAIVGAISSIISMYFYIGLIIKMYFNEPADKKLEPTKSPLSSFAYSFAWIALLVLGLFPGLITNILESIF
jgi:NADH-quinone oxidoreductase subunit N